MAGASAVKVRFGAETQSSLPMARPMRKSLSVGALRAGVSCAVIRGEGGVMARVGALGQRRRLGDLRRIGVGGSWRAEGGGVVAASGEGAVEGGVVAGDLVELVARTDDGDLHTFRGDGGAAADGGDLGFEAGGGLVDGGVSGLRGAGGEDEEGKQGERAGAAIKVAHGSVNITKDAALGW